MTHITPPRGRRDTLAGDQEALEIADRGLQPDPALSRTITTAHAGNSFLLMRKASIPLRQRAGDYADKPSPSTVSTRQDRPPVGITPTSV
jgi:hypothetical protein